MRNAQGNSLRCTILVGGYGSPKQWQANKLRFVVSTLKHNQCMPLLLAACKLKPKHFVESLDVLAKFFFRYKIVCKAHVTPMLDAYLNQANKINSNPNVYQVKFLRDALQELLEKRAQESVFRAELGVWCYDEKGSNRELKCLLVTLDENWKWFEGNCKGGVNGRWKKEDQARPFDFDTTTIEHIYPKGAKAADIVVDLEPLKHSLGNLTPLDPSTNSGVGNIAFSSKKNSLKNCNCPMTREVGAKSQWTKLDLEQRAQRLIEAATKIYAV